MGFKNVYNSRFVALWLTLIWLAYNCGVEAGCAYLVQPTQVVDKSVYPHVIKRTLQHSKRSIYVALTEQQYSVIHRGDADNPNYGYNGTDKDGIYRCVVCDTEHFKTDDKITIGHEIDLKWPQFKNHTGPLEYKDQVDHDGEITEEIYWGECYGYMGDTFKIKEHNVMRWIVSPSSVWFENNIREGNDVTEELSRVDALNERQGYDKFVNEEELMREDLETD